MTTAAGWARLELPWGASLDLALPDTYDVLADEVLRFGTHFPPHFELALDIAPPGGVVLDLGAHLGTFALAAAASGRRVIAVEASPRNIELLDESAHANGLDHLITLIPSAITNSTGTVRFREEGAWGQIDKSSGGRRLLQVPGCTGDEMLAELRLDRVDLVKMDVEGSELAVIEGMRGLLARSDAPVVVFEGNAHTLRMFDATPEDLIGAIAALGYKSYIVGRRELTPVTTASFQPETIVDYVAVKPDLDLPPIWQVSQPRGESDLARVVHAESCDIRVDYRAQVARSLERAPGTLLARRDVQLVLSALALDPNETVARAASWSARADRVAERTHMSQFWQTRVRFLELAEQGRALRDRVQQIRVRWGARP